MKTEAAILEATERLAHGRTSFLITHRHTALRDCDVLLRIEHGRLGTVTSAVPAVAMEGGAGGLHDAVPHERRTDV